MSTVSKSSTVKSEELFAQVKKSAASVTYGRGGLFDGGVRLNIGSEEICTGGAEVRHVFEELARRWNLTAPED